MTGLLSEKKPHQSLIQVTITWLVAIFLVFGNSVNAETVINYSRATKPIKFDPAKCSQNPEGMTYVAIGKIVFRHPSDKIQNVSSVASDNTEVLNVPPRPSDPQGCPDNPIQERGARFLLGYPKIIENLYPGFLVSLGYSTDNSKDTEYVRSNEKLFDLVCAHPDHLELNDVPGMKGCRTFHKNMPSETEWAYKGSDYRTPTGRNFILTCRLSQFITGKWCRVEYAINDYIRLGYSFNNEIPIASIIQFDKNLRQQIMTEEVKNYSWANALSDKK